MKNRIFIMRHGESLANRKKLIVSKAANGLDGYGLSETGKQQAMDSLETETRLDRDTVIISSDFKRAAETAEIVVEKLAVRTPPVFDQRLRERGFGDFELSNSENYKQVWQLDKQDPQHTSNGVESVIAVVERLKKLLIDIEQQYEDKNILLVSHGDILQMLQTVFESIPAAEHRSIKHLKTAEIRRLI